MEGTNLVKGETDSADCTLIKSDVYVIIVFKLVHSNFIECASTS